MRRFNNLDLTDEEWDEIIYWPKEFKKGDIVENESARGSKKGHVWEVVRKVGNDGEDDLYELKNLNSGEHGWATSKFMYSIGTFIDDETYAEVKPDNK